MPGSLPFFWEPVQTGDLKLEKGAILLPVSIAGWHAPVLMQLDTGASRTCLYGNAFEQPPDEKDLQGVTVTVGACLSACVDVAVDTTLGSRGDRSKGTVGVDVLAQGFVLDLANQTIGPLGDDDPRWHWQAAAKVNGSPVVQVQDGKASLRLLFDTGSSAFTLLSTPSLSPGLAQSVPLRTLQVPSFGRELTITEMAPVQPLCAFGRQLDLHCVYAFQDPGIEQLLRQAGIDGLIGLAAFHQHTLAFDLPRGRIGLLEH